MRDDLPHGAKNRCFLYNLDSKMNGGTHWTTVCLQHPEIYYFDPFGTKMLGGYPPQELRIWGKNHGFNIIYANENDIQHIKSNLCGYYSLFMANKLRPMIGKLNEKRFDNIISNEFDLLPTTYNVNKVMKWSHSHKLI